MFSRYDFENLNWSLGSAGVRGHGNSEWNGVCFGIWETALGIQRLQFDYAWLEWDGITRLVGSKGWERFDYILILRIAPKMDTT